MSKKHGKSTGLNVMRADIQDVWINDKSKSYYLLVFPGSTTMELA